MDKLRITGENLREIYQSPQKLSQVFSDIEQDLALQNLIVCRYIVNSHVLTDQDSLEFSNMPMAAIETLEIWTDHVKHLAPQIIESWKVALPKLILDCEDLAACLRFEGFQGQMPKLHRLTENCEYLVESLVSLKQTLGDEIMTQFPTWNMIETEMQHLVSEAYLAVEKKDYSLLADVIEFDLITNLEKWSQFLDFAQEFLV